MANGPYYRDEARPFLQRSDTMSLDIIRPKDIPKGKVMYVKDDLTSLKTEDLYKAKPTYDHLNYLDKPDYSVGCTDVDHAGGCARSYYPPMDRRPRDLSLTTADIEYAQPKNKNWKGNRHTDPVCPNYEMPSYVRREPTPPRWNGRHLHDISDIEYSRPRVLHPDRNYVRDPNDGRDIEYASANYHERLKRQNSFGPGPDRTFDVSDIAAKKPPQPRCVNPLDPVYTVSTNKTTSLHAKYNEEHHLGLDVLAPEPEQIGEVHMSKPRKLQWDNSEPQLSLMREDIAGTVPQRWVGAVPHNIYDPPEVRSMLSFHDPHDIPGAQVGSLRKGIVTGRTLNPLNPRYPMLDGDAKPDAMPTIIEAERMRPGAMAHPLAATHQLASSSSLPNLRSANAKTLAEQMLQHDASQGQLGGIGGAGGSAGGSQQQSRGPSRGQSGHATPMIQSGLATPWRQSGHGTPLAQSGRATPLGRSGHQLVQQGITLRLPAEVEPASGVYSMETQTGELSRRSNLSRRSGSQASLRGQPQPSY